MGRAGRLTARQIQSSLGQWHLCNEKNAQGFVELSILPVSILHPHNEEGMPVLGRPGIRGSCFPLRAAVSLCRCAEEEQWSRVSL